MTMQANSFYLKIKHYKTNIYFYFIKGQRSKYYISVYSLQKIIKCGLKGQGTAYFQSKISYENVKYDRKKLFHKYFLCKTPVNT